MILISIPVHEKPDVILSQIENIKRFVPSAMVVIHPALQFVEEYPSFPSEFAKFDHVVINDNPLYTGFGMVLKCHVSNFNYAQKVGLPFTHFCFHASNEIFVRKGVEHYIARHDYGFFQERLNSGRIGFSQWKTEFDNDLIYRNVMREGGRAPTRFASQVEGTFYPRAAFEDFIRCFMRYGWAEIRWPFRYVHGTHRKLITLMDRLQRNPNRRKYIGQFSYPTEEFYQPNFFSSACPHPANPYCYMNWKENLLVTRADIDSIRAGGVPSGEYHECYSVKRINRNVHDPLRIMIQLLG